MSNRQAGFTLIEVMVAIMLMAIVSLIAWRGLDSVTRADTHLQASTAQTEELLRTLHQLERDIALRVSIELREPDLTNNDDGPPAGPGAITVRSADNQTFRLDVIRSAAAQQAGLQRVRWWLKGQTLYRAAAPARDRYPLPAPKEGVAVLDSISDLQVRVWEPDMGWRQLSGNRIEDPPGLEIRLTRVTPQGEEHYRQVLGPLD
ncbi:type II secretion system protein J [Pseudomonas sp. TH43]|uniref:PulJ/GspJ family protein n=1 Tax=Pseudomonas sp. TH43 TaxID=2796407 RepID=UPI0019141B23|nr:prepilin-type N-terminal cleavage/methylation domain-containing protein [Pseudomonas sp. TH43]MBK5374896.1 type II secretion system protein J [Pseudomonas sp. TH43]